MVNKPFEEALSDGFRHIKTINDPERLKRLREDGVLIDSDGLHVFEFGDKHEYSLEIQPISSEGIYRIVLYKNKIVITEPLHVKAL